MRNIIWSIIGAGGEYIRAIVQPIPSRRRQITVPRQSISTPSLSSHCFRVQQDWPTPPLNYYNSSFQHRENVRTARGRQWKSACRWIYEDSAAKVVQGHANSLKTLQRPWRVYLSNWPLCFFIVISVILRLILMEI